MRIVAVNGKGTNNGLVDACMKSKGDKPEILTPSGATPPLHSTPNDAETMSDMLDRSMAEISSRYQILSIAGQGGMGVVYRARDRETGDQVAIKVLKPEIASDRASPPAS